MLLFMCGCRTAGLMCMKTYRPFSVHQAVFVTLSTTRYAPVISRELLTQRVANGIPLTASAGGILRQFNRTKLIMSRETELFVPKYKKDKVPENYELIMQRGMRRYYFWCQMFTYIFIFPTILYCGYLIGVTLPDVWNGKVYDLDHPIFMSSVAFVFSIALVSLTSYICRRSITRMYYNSDKKTFIAITQNSMMVPQKVSFRLHDCKRIIMKQNNYDIKAMKGNVRIKGRPFLLNVFDFKVMRYYNWILGYEEDKPHRKIEDIEIYNPIVRKKS